MPPAIRTQLVFDAAEPHALAAFWAQALHYEHEEIGDFVQGLLDAGHDPEELTTEVARLEGLGATKLDEHDGPDGRWILMTDPEGNEFDVA